MESPWSQQYQRASFPAFNWRSKHDTGCVDCLPPPLRSSDTPNDFAKEMVSSWDLLARFLVRVLP